MSDFLNSDLIEFDNDASASSFGWNFQSNAGIFLFLHYIDNAENLVIESKLQDIEITLRNQEKILAQAKSSQEPSNDKAKKEKFKDAIISIAKTSKKEPNAHFIYISNEPNTFDSANRAFDNKVRSYDECLTAIKTEIDSVIEATIKSLNAKIQKLEQKKSEKTNGKDNNCKKKFEEIRNLLSTIEKKNLSFSCLPQFWGTEENRYDDVKKKIDDFLVNKLHLQPIDAIKVSKSLFNYWQHECNFNSTCPDDDNKFTKITKADFIWPVSIFLIDGNFPDIADCLTFPLDLSLEDNVQRIINEPKFLYHERFEFSNKVIQDFVKYRRTLPPGSRDIEKDFIKNNAVAYYNEFQQENYDNEILEYVTKIWMLRIVQNWRNLQDICKAVGVNR